MGFTPEDLEDQFYSKDKKLGRQERKRATFRDRSKFKKTDRDKYQEGLTKEFSSKSESANLIHGRVISIVPEGIIVATDKETYACQLRGLLKKHKTEAKNLVTVGDFVRLEPKSIGEGTIVVIEPRKSVLTRADNIDQKKMQILAANVDQVLITVSVGTPPLRPPIVDRYIIAALKGNMSPVIVVNKMDLVEEQEELFEDFLVAYEQAHIPIVCISCEKGEGLDELKLVMKDKVSVFSGQSGVGKSSLINAVSDHQLKIGELVERTRKGTHTTTTASFLPLPFGGWVIDTPGIKSFGLWDLKKEELLKFYPEFQEHPCRYPNCTHTHEPACGVREAIEEGTLSPIRYNSYINLLTELEQDHLRR